MIRSRASNLNWGHITDACSRLQLARSRPAALRIPKASGQVATGLRGRPRGRGATGLEKVVDESLKKRGRSDRPASLHRAGQLLDSLRPGVRQALPCRRHSDRTACCPVPSRRDVSERKLRRSSDVLSGARPRLPTASSGVTPFANRSLINEHHRLEERSSALHHRGAIAAIPDAAAALMATIERRGEAPAQCLHGAAQSLCARRRAQQPHVVRQQGIGVQRHPLATARALQS